MGSQEIDIINYTEQLEQIIAQNAMMLDKYSLVADLLQYLVYGISLVFIYYIAWSIGKKVVNAGVR